MKKVSDQQNKDRNTEPSSPGRPRDLRSASAHSGLSVIAEEAVAIIPRKEGAHRSLLLGLGVGPLPARAAGRGRGGAEVRWLEGGGERLA